MESETVKKRGWLQFRLSSLGLLVLFVALGLTGYRRYVAYQALVTVSRKAEYVRPIPATPSGWSKFFDDSVYDVRHLSFHDKAQVTDDDMAHVARLKSLRRLSLHRTAVTDASAESIAKLKKLETLSLHRAQFTDASMELIGTLRNLKSLNLNYTKVTGDGIRHLIKLPHLEELRVEGIPFAKNDLEHIAKLDSLTDIRLEANCGFSWRSMPALKSAHVFLKNSNDDISITDLPALEKLTIDVKYVPGGRNSMVRISSVPKLTQILVLGAGS